MDIGTLPFTPQQLVMDKTGEDLSQFMPNVGSRGGMHVQFYYQRIEVESLDGGISYQNRLCVVKQPKGDRLTVYVGFISEREAAQRWPAEWAAFKRSEAVPTTGTPLAELPGITQQQVGLLLVHGLRSIEDLAECDASVVRGMGIVVAKAQQMAQGWLARKTANADLIASSETKALAEAKERELQRQLDQMRQSLMDATAQIKALQSMGGGAGGASFARMSGDPIPVADDPLPERPFVGADGANDGFAGVVTGADDLNDLP